ncbi:MAG: outer membrane beta-barrel protein [Chitinophagaceae bacterium]|nr:outer membrane beta-barrel protein [Chitinophagaceae bacterium]
MEKLFRRAAENYELDTGKASDWEGVHKKLSETGADEKEGKKKKRRFIFWWFLLFPAGWIAHNTWDKIGKAAFSREPVVLQKQLTKADEPVGTNTTQPGERTGMQLEEAVKTFEKKSELKGRSSEKKAGGMADRKDKVVIGPGIVENHAWMTLRQRVDERDFVLPALSVAKYIPVEVVTNNKERDPPAGDSNKISKPDAVPADRGFYAQAIAAPDLTSVKFQRISGTGSSIGLLLGYRLNKRLHIEAAAYWEKKVYYTKGAYFDKSRLAYFNNHEIYNVDGDCHMITVPVNLRYNFVSRKSSDWFVTGGAAAYLMQKEYYDITYEYYGDRRTKGYTYKNAPKSWLSTVNIGVGYQAAMWKSFHVRVEPYLRIPVSGAGTGKLPLTSAGVYVGIGRKF